MGKIGHPATSVRNCQSTLHNIAQQHRAHMMIWWCRPWFGSAMSGSEWSSLVRSGSVLHMQI